MATQPQTPSEERRPLQLNRPVQTRLASFGRQVLDFFVYTSAYLALVATAETLIVTELLSLPLSPAPVVAGLLTFAVYGNDRLTDLETDALSAPMRTAYVRRYRGILYVLAAVSYGLAVAIAVLGGPLAFGLALLPGAVWLLYARDWVPSLGVDVRRLKEILILNSMLVAVAWSLVIVFLPLAFVDAAVTPTAGVVFLFFVMATFVNTEIPNVRDMEGDREIGVATLPVVFGVRRTRYVLYGVTLLTAVVLGGAVVSDVMSLAPASVLVGCLACLSAVICCLGRVRNAGTLAIAAECTRLPALALLVLPLFGP